MDDVWLPSTRGLVHCKARLVEKRLQARAREVGDGSAPRSDAGARRHGRLTGGSSWLGRVAGDGPGLHLEGPGGNSALP